MDDGKDDRECVTTLARSLAQRGVSAAEVRGYGAPFWAAIADEVEIIEARRRFRVLPGGVRLRPPPEGRRGTLTAVQ